MCSTNATCEVNQCTCKPGYKGDGMNCVPDGSVSLAVPVTIIFGIAVLIAVGKYVATGTGIGYLIYNNIKGYTVYFDLLQPHEKK
jgi:hypothetical protein